MTPFAIKRGLLAEDEDEVQEFLDRIVESFAPRDALEQEEAQLIALARLRMRRVARFEALAIAGDGTEHSSSLHTFGEDSTPEGRAERAAATAIRETLDRSTKIDARSNQVLARAERNYARLQERPIDTTEVPCGD